MQPLLRMQMGYHHPEYSAIDFTPPIVLYAPSTFAASFFADCVVLSMDGGVLQRGDTASID